MIRIERCTFRCDTPFDLYGAKDNPMFSPELIALVRFQRFAAKVPCCLCGKKRKRHWTMIVPFQAFEFGSFALRPSDRSFFAFAPVCNDHPTEPLFLIGPEATESHSS